MSIHTKEFHKISAWRTNLSAWVLSRRWTAWVVMWMAMGVIGCVSLDQMVPPIDQRIIEYGQKQGVSDQSLLTGRLTYLNRCNSCHGIEPIDRYSVEQWEVIVPEMSKEAKLNDAQMAALLNYIRTARGFIDLSKPDLQHGGS